MSGWTSEEARQECERLEAKAEMGLGLTAEEGGRMTELYLTYYVETDESGWTSAEAEEEYHRIALKRPAERTQEEQDRLTYLFDRYFVAPPEPSEKVSKKNFDDLKRLMKSLPPRELSLFDIVTETNGLGEEDQQKFIFLFLAGKIQAGKPLTDQEIRYFHWLEIDDAGIEDFRRLALEHVDRANPTKLYDTIEQIHARIAVMRHVDEKGMPKDLPAQDQALIRELMKNPLAGMSPAHMTERQKGAVKDLLKNVAYGIAGLFGKQEQADKVLGMFKKSPLLAKSDALDRLTREYEQARAERPAQAETLKYIYEEEKRKILES